MKTQSNLLNNLTTEPCLKLRYGGKDVQSEGGDPVAELDQVLVSLAWQMQVTHIPCNTACPLGLDQDHATSLIWVKTGHKVAFNVHGWWHNIEIKGQNHGRIIYAPLSCKYKILRTLYHMSNVSSRINNSFLCILFVFSLDTRA